MDYQWWPGQPVFEVSVTGGVANREQAFNLAKTMVDQIEGSGYPHVIVILDLSDLGQSPSAAALLGGALPETPKIEHMILINAPLLMRLAASAFVHLRDKLHFVKNRSQADAKAQTLLFRLPK